MRYNTRARRRTSGTSRKKWGLRVNIVIFITLLISLLILLNTTLDKRIMPVAVRYGMLRAKYMANTMTNNAVNNVLSNYNITYDDLFTMEKNSNGEVTAVVADVVLMNKLKADMMTQMASEINSIDDEIVLIPLGSVSGSDFFANLGPKIPIKIKLGGTMTFDFKNSFVTEGINQTKHEMYLEAVVDVSITLPSRAERATITSTVPITSTIIVGNVPEVTINTTLPQY